MGTGEGDAGARPRDDLLSVVGREHTITERSMVFVPYGFGEYSEGALTGVFDKIGRLKCVMPSHKMKWTNRASHGKGEIL
jgi:hypothetical protein